MVSIDGTEISDLTIDGDAVSEVTMDGDIVWKALDTEIYLHDDWGDNKLQNRNGTETVTYNGVEGVYRPEWTLDNGSATANNEQLNVDSGDTLYTDINLNLSETITWEWDNVLIEGDGQSTLQCWSETTSRTWGTGNSQEPGYFVWISDAGDDIRFFKVIDGGGTTTLISSSGNVGSPNDLSVTRDSSGEWVLYINGNWSGSETDTTNTSPQYISFSSRSGADMTIDEMKVY